MEDCGYDIRDPKHPDHYETFADAWDMRRDNIITTKIHFCCGDEDECDCLEKTQPCCGPDGCS